VLVFRNTQCFTVNGLDEYQARDLAAKTRHSVKGPGM
jgi:hypothetical protein